MIRTPLAGALIFLSLAFLISSSAARRTSFARDPISGQPQSVPALDKIGKDYRISTGATLQSRSPAVAYNSMDNEFMVVWYDSRNLATTGPDIFASESRQMAT